MHTIEVKLQNKKIWHMKLMENISFPPAHRTLKGCVISRLSLSLLWREGFPVRHMLLSESKTEPRSIKNVAPQGGSTQQAWEPSCQSCLLFGVQGGGPANIQTPVYKPFGRPAPTDPMHMTGGLRVVPEHTGVHSACRCSRRAAMFTCKHANSVDIYCVLWIL